MRGGIAGLVLITLTLSLACTSVYVEYYDSEYYDSPTDSALGPKPPIGRQELPTLDPSIVERPDLTGPQAESCPGIGIARQARATAQETDTWCWAASAQMVMNAHGENTKQCDIVNSVKNLGDCCVEGNRFPPGICWQNGWPGQAFSKFGFIWEWSPGPLSRHEIGGQFCKFGPFIYILQYEGGGGHSLVVQDVDVMSDGEVILWVHDHWWVDDTLPRSSTPIYPISYDDYVQGVWGENRHKLEFNYVLIRRS